MRRHIDLPMLVNSAIGLVSSIGVLIAALLTIHPHGAGRVVFAAVLAAVALLARIAASDAYAAWRGEITDDES